MKKHLIFFTVLTIASVIFSGCATPSYQNSYVDPIFDQIDREDVQYRTYVNNQLGSRTITQDQANFLLERHGQIIEYRKLKRQIELSDPAMAVYLENEESYISKMQEALEKGEISKAEYDQKVQETKFRIAQFGQQRQTLRSSQAYTQAQIDAAEQQNQIARQNMLLNYWQNARFQSIAQQNAYTQSFLNSKSVHCTSRDSLGTIYTDCY